MPFSSTAPISGFNNKISEKNFQPKLNWSKKKTFYFIDYDRGGYLSYNIYDDNITNGQHYDSYFEISPNCGSAFRPQQQFDARNLGAALISGILRDVLEVPASYKAGRNAKIMVFK